MAETSYENLTRRIDRISAEIREISEKNGIRRLSLLANQTKSIKERFKSLLFWFCCLQNDKQISKEIT